MGNYTTLCHVEAISCSCTPSVCHYRRRRHYQQLQPFTFRVSRPSFRPSIIPSFFLPLSPSYLPNRNTLQIEDGPNFGRTSRIVLLLVTLVTHSSILKKEVTCSSKISGSLSNYTALQPCKPYSSFICYRFSSEYYFVFIYKANFVSILQNTVRRNLGCFRQCNFSRAIQRLSLFRVQSVEFRHD
jgi:hypothetical protein